MYQQIFRLQTLAKRSASEKKISNFIYDKSKSCTIKPLFCLLADVINSLTKTRSRIVVVFFIKQILRLQRERKVFSRRAEDEMERVWNSSNRIIESMMGITLLIFLSFYRCFSYLYADTNTGYSLEKWRDTAKKSFSILRETLNPYNKTLRLFHFFVHFERDLIMN